MPNLSVVKTQQRISQAIQVLLLTSQNNISVDQACDVVGISRDVYYRWLREGENTVNEFLTLKNDLQRMTYAGILSSQYAAIAELLNEVRDETTKPIDRVAILKYLDEVRTRIEEEFRAQGAVNDEAANYLQGPQVAKAQSRLRASTVNIAPLSDGSIDITTYAESDIVDGHIISREPPEDLE